MEPGLVSPVRSISTVAPMRGHRSGRENRVGTDPSDDDDEGRRRPPWTWWVTVALQGLGTFSAALTAITGYLKMRSGVM